MASSTTNKKEIVDFLWEWAEGNEDWGKLLIQKVVDIESSLQYSDREEVFKYFLESVGLEKDLPKLSFVKPSYIPSDQYIELGSLTEVVGVNKLAANQTINFSPNITVIYGENGTGKTGYGRILKALGFSYDRNNTIYSNVFGNPHQPKSATINYKVNGNPDTFTWNGENRDQELENISVFNSDCVQISLDASRQLIVSPIGFHLFNLVSAELGELDSLLKAKKSEHPTQLSWIENLHEGTHQHQFIDSLSKDRNEKCLNELSDFTLEHEKDLERKETEISKLNKSLLQNEVEVRLQLNYESFGLDDQDKPLQPQKLQDYNQFLTDLKKTFVEDKVAEDSVFQLNYVDYIQFFTEKKSEIDKIVIEKSKLLGNLDKNEKELKAKIAELKDRKLLSSKKEEVKKAISNHKILSVLNSHSNSFNTSSISRKTSQAREELVSQNFNHIFQDELKALRKSSLQIELSFGTDRGRSKLSHRIGNKQLLEILSEGEQKAIALSEFLTELQLDNVKAPVIFDDPVNSLDHKIIDAVAKRMVRLSKDRQVVIFTHSVLLFNSLLYLSTQPNFKSVKCSFFNVKKEYGEVGVITEAQEEKNKVKENISKINQLINNTPKERSENDVAKEGFAELRSAVELFIEHEVFNGTVQRYQKHISLGRFINVKSDIISSHKETLNDIYERCCGFIGAHSNPEVVYNDPTLDDLKADFDEFKNIRKMFV